MSIELNHISCSYPGGAQESVTVFDDFSLHIAEDVYKRQDLNSVYVYRAALLPPPEIQMSRADAP